MYTKNWHNSNDRPKHCRRETINNIGSSSNRSPRRSYWRKGVEDSTGNVAGASTKSTVTVVNMDSTDGLDNGRYCRVCLAQSRRASECPLMPSQLRIKLSQNRNESLEALSRRRSSFYRPRYGRWNPSSPKNKFLTPSTKQLRAAHNHFPKGRATRASPLREPKKNQSRRLPQRIPS